MQQQLPKVLVMCGVVMMLIGVIATVAMLAIQDRCHHDQTGYPDDPGVAAVCSSYQTGADWGFLVLATGAVVIVAGAISASPRLRSNEPRP